MNNNMGMGMMGMNNQGGGGGGFDPNAMAMMYQNMMKNNGMGKHISSIRSPRMIEARRSEVELGEEMIKMKRRMGLIIYRRDGYGSWI